ncbi:hypothetical protein [Iningainema tapete]|uniref:hypothetical protein n=1 Tax=Iningainema tapete TaxID=2806730 RepID=UPI001EE2DFEA|nr:hypothetical protein [Iningainema tapete]
MKNTQASDSYNNGEDDLLPEYNFDYRKARPNYFATQKDKPSVIVTLDPDVEDCIHHVRSSKQCASYHTIGNSE